MVNKPLIKLLQEAGVIRHGKFKLRNGSFTTYYCDIKEALGNPKILREIVKRIIPLIPSQTTCIAASGYGGIALASIVSYKTNLPLVLVRDKVKDHGTKKIIDGYAPSRSDRVCIIDDVFTTGSSIRDAKQKLAQTKCKFVKPVVVLNRSKKNEVIYLLKDSDLIKN